MLSGFSKPPSRSESAPEPRWAPRSVIEKEEKTEGLCLPYTYIYIQMSLFFRILASDTLTTVYMHVMHMQIAGGSHSTVLREQCWGAVPCSRAPWQQAGGDLAPGQLTVRSPAISTNAFWVQCCHLVLASSSNLEGVNENTHAGTSNVSHLSSPLLLVHFHPCGC